MKLFIDKYFGTIASAYRLFRDKKKFSKSKLYQTSLGFDFIGVADVPAGRLAAGEIGFLQEQLSLSASTAFIDIGANCGVFTLLAATSGMLTLAFEPNAENYQLLLRNLEYNRINNVEAFQIALSSEPGVQYLYGGGEGASLLKNWGGMAHTYSRLTSINTLDNLIGARFANDRLFIKIDVEGNEFAVLAGAFQLLTKDPAPVWMIEHSFTENFTNGINPHFQDIFELFWQHGYEVYTADAEKRLVTRIDVLRWLQSGTRDFGYVNYIFTKTPA